MKTRHGSSCAAAGSGEEGGGEGGRKEGGRTATLQDAEGAESVRGSGSGTGRAAQVL